MKILFATDRSSDSAHAAWLLRRLSFREPVELTVMTVAPTLEFAEPSSIPLEIRNIVDAEQEQLRAELHQIAKPLDGIDGTVTTRLAIGDPAAEILKAAEKIRADLIVLGARGQSRIERILLGSVSDRVATHAACSVLVVRDTGLEQSPERPTRLMMALDASPYDRNQIDLVKTLNWGATTDLHLVRVLETLGIFSQNVIETSQPYWVRLRNEARAGLEAIQGDLADVAPQSRVVTIDSTHVGEALVDYSDRQQIDLLTVGDRGHGVLARMLLGSTSRHVLRHARSSVIIARQRSAKTD